MKSKEKYELEAQQGWRKYNRKRLITILREFWVHFRNYNQILHAMQALNPKEVVDIGCEVISVANLLVDDIPSTNFTGIDPLMDEYKKLYEFDKRVSWVNGYAESIPFENEHFDTAISSNALDHVEDIKQSFAEISRVIRKGGLFMLIVHVFRDNTRYSRGEGHPFNLTRLRH